MINYTFNKRLSKKYNEKITIITNKVNKAKNLLINETSVKKVEYISFQRENQIKILSILQKIPLIPIFIYLQHLHED